MKILALEFSSPQRSVAIWAEGKVRARGQELGSRETRALTLIAQALNDAQLAAEEIDCLAVGLGPGSYTGVRIAIALAQGWQLARNIKLLGMSSADCVAAQAHAAGWRGRMNLLMDARREECYQAVYELIPSGWRELKSFAPCRTAEPRDGNEAEEIRVRFDAHAECQKNERLLLPDAAMLAQLAAGRSDFVPGEKLEPIYLRETLFVKAPSPRFVSTS